jgi:hypothetical protein
MTKDEGDARVGQTPVISTAGRNPRSTLREQEELVAEYWLLMSAY